MDSLEDAARRALIESLPPGLKAAIDTALAGGATPEQLLARIHRQTGGPLAQPGGLTYLGACAYVESKATTPTDPTLN